MLLYACRHCISTQSMSMNSGTRNKYILVKNRWCIPRKTRGCRCCPANRQHSKDSVHVCHSVKGAGCNSSILINRKKKSSPSYLSCRGDLGDLHPRDVFTNYHSITADHCDCDCDADRAVAYSAWRSNAFGSPVFTTEVTRRQARAGLHRQWFEARVNRLHPSPFFFTVEVV